MKLGPLLEIAFLDSVSRDAWHPSDASVEMDGRVEVCGWLHSKDRDWIRLVSQRAARARGGLFQVPRRAIKAIINRDDQATKAARRIRLLETEAEVSALRFATTYTDQDARIRALEGKLIAMSQREAIDFAQLQQALDALDRGHILQGRELLDSALSVAMGRPRTQASGIGVG
jgi:hypothetical protein